MAGRERTRRKKKTPPSRSWWRRASRYGLLGVASHAVIGTLRPTDRRRAYHPRANCVPFYFKLRTTSNYVPPAAGVSSSHHGADRDRTGDLCSAIAALSQLSYSPL